MMWYIIRDSCNGINNRNRHLPWQCKQRSYCRALLFEHYNSSSCICTVRNEKNARLALHNTTNSACVSFGSYAEGSLKPPKKQTAKCLRERGGAHWSESTTVKWHTYHISGKCSNLHNASYICSIIPLLFGLYVVHWLAVWWGFRLIHTQKETWLRSQMKNQDFFLLPYKHTEISHYLACACL